MKTVKQIVAQTENGLPTQSWTSRTSTGNSQQSGNISGETKALVNMLFARFMAIYGHKFKSTFQSENEVRLAKREWALSLQGFHESAIVQAIDHCKVSFAWMPTISEFLSILADIQPGSKLKTSRQAYMEACANASQPSQSQWSHPAVYYAAKDVGWFELRSESEAKTYPLFEHAYRQLCIRAQMGEDMTMPTFKALENNAASSFAAEVAQWAEANAVPPEEAAKILFYKTLPANSQVRARQRQVGEIRLARIAPQITLPE